MADDQTWFKQNYVNPGKLRPGSFGPIYSAKRSSKNVFGQQNGKEVAVKIIKFTDVEQLRAKAELMTKFEHWAVAKVFNYFVDVGNGFLYLEMEYFDGGSLAQYMENFRGNSYPIEQFQQMFQQAAFAVKCLHEDFKLVHRNIKPTNIFLTNGGTEIKLGEFFLSTLLNSAGNLHPSNLRYMSPQAVGNMPASFVDDVWSLGAMLYEMATNEPLFQGNTAEKIWDEILLSDRKKQQRLDRIPYENLRDLLSKMLEISACDRCSMASVMAHPFVTGWKSKMQANTRRNQGSKSWLSSLSGMKPEEQIDFLNSKIIGRNLIIETCFGPKLKLYVDYTASGQELSCSSEMLTRIAELYANTHTETSATGAFMNKLLAKSEAAILKVVNADEKDYFLLCGGSGSTWAIEMTQKLLGTNWPPATRERVLKLSNLAKSWESLKNQLRDEDLLPLVFVSHYEHHSNETTWRNQLCDVVECPPRQDGKIDLVSFESNLKIERDRGSQRQIIGSFSAGSNVTGIKSDVLAVSKLLKKYNAFTFFDYAAVGPYLAIDLSQKTEDDQCLIDGIYISPHKFLGGPGSSGILVFNRKVYNSKLEPTHGGGGTVDYVWRHGQSFTEDPAHREQSGTPGILQIIKAGLAFQLKSILQSTIDDKERSLLARYKKIASLENLEVLGPRFEKEKVGIISFLIHHDGPSQTGRRYLHPNLIALLLNDIFGIQARSGCSCAGPYGQYLLNITDRRSEKFRFWVEAHETYKYKDHLRFKGFKPGWARINLHFTMTDYEMDYLLLALRFLCEHGHRFLAVYNFDPVSGQWRHINDKAAAADDDPKQSEFLEIIDAMPDCNYAKSEEDRRRLFETQMKEAKALLDKLPAQIELDSVDDMPICYFYVAKGHLLHPDLIKKKLEAFVTHFGRKHTDLVSPSQKPA